MVKRLGRRVLLPVAFWLAVWELCYRAVGQDLLLASPGQVVAYLAGGMNATFWGCVGMSLVRTGAAYVLGVVLGVALAVLCHWAPLLGEVIRPALAVVRLRRWPPLSSWRWCGSPRGMCPFWRDC